MSAPKPHSKRESRISALYGANLKQLGDQDIVLASYGAAGQTIVSNLLQELGFNYVDPYTELVRPDGTSAAVQAHAAFRQRFAAMHKRDTGLKPIARRWPRFVKTHLPYEVFEGRNLLGVWLIVRDPRDAMFGWYKWRAAFAEEVWDKVDGDFENFITQPDYTGNLPAIDWARYYAAWSEHAPTFKYFAVTRFEDFKTDPLDTAYHGLAAFGLQVPENELLGALRRSSFETMQQHENTILSGSGNSTMPSHMVRRGKVGEWKEWMTPRLSRYFGGGEVRTVAARYGYRDLLSSTTQ